jgi:hypothetical protein
VTTNLEKMFFINKKERPRKDNRVEDEKGSLLKKEGTWQSQQFS